MAETVAKRCKYEQSSDINSDFKEFSSNADFIKLIGDKLDKLQTVDFSFRMLRIEKCNANRGICFSQAHCQTRTNVRTGHLVRNRFVTTLDAYKFSTLYASGIRLLKDFLCNPKQIPGGVVEKTALKRLLNTLINLESIKSCLKRAHSKIDCDWTLVLTQHLLRNLAVNQSFRVDDRNGARSDSCSCCKQTICGKFGDTSIGCTSIWHGYIDLILGSEVPVVTVNEESMTGNQPTDEVRSVSEFPSKRREQIIAQTTVFSFLQKKGENSYENYLIPCVGVAKNYVTFFMYGCENDILLESAHIKLLSVQGGDIFETGVLALWLAINYRYTCSGVTQHMIDAGFKAEFPKHVGKELETYQNSVQFCCGLGDDKKDLYVPDEIDYINLH